MHSAKYGAVLKNGVTTLTRGRFTSCAIRFEINDVWNYVRRGTFRSATFDQPRLAQTSGFVKSIIPFTHGVDGVKSGQVDLIAGGGIVVTSYIAFFDMGQNNLYLEIL